MMHLWRDQWRKIWKSRLRFLSLGLLVAIIAMTYTAMASSVRRLDEDHESYLQEQSVEDFYFNMGEVDVDALSGRALWSLCQELSLELECGIAISKGDALSYNHLNVQINQAIQANPDVYEALLDSYADAFVDTYNYTYEKDYVVDVVEGDYAYKFMQVTNQINLPYLVAGSLPDAFQEVAIFPEFAEHNDIDIGDTMTIRGQSYLVSGFMYKPEFLFPIMSLQSVRFDPAHQTIVLTTKDTIDALGDAPFIKYLVQGDLDAAFSDFGYDAVQAADYSALGKQMSMVQILLPRDINFRIIALATEVTNAQAFLRVFLPLFTALAGVLLVTFMKRHLEQNQRDIHTLRALGYSNVELSFALLLFPVLVASFVFLGYLLGLVLARELFEIYSERYLFPKAPFTLYPEIFLFATLLPFVGLVLLNYGYIRMALRLRPTRRRVRLRWSRFVTPKTLLQTSMLWLVIGVLLLFGLNGNHMFTDFLAYTKTGNHYEEMIHLRYLTNTDHLDSYETYTKTPVSVIGVNGDVLKSVTRSTLYGISPETTLKRLVADDIHNNLWLEDGLIISEYLHTALGIQTGDILVIEIGAMTHEAQVMGISNELLENNIYMDQATLNAYFGLDETYYNGLFTTDSAYVSPDIISRINYVASLDEFANVLEVSSRIVQFLVVLSLVLALYMTALILINHIAEHAKDIALLRSIGYDYREIHWRYLIPLYVLMVALYLVAIPITDWLLNALLGQLMETIGFKLVVRLRWSMVLLGLFLLHVLFVIAIHSTTKYYDRIPIALTLKQKDHGRLHGG